MTPLDWFLIACQWIGAVISYTGAILIGNKQRKGFLVFLVGDFILALPLIHTFNFGTLALLLAFAHINIKNYLKWDSD